VWAERGAQPGRPRSMIWHICLMNFCNACMASRLLWACAARVTMAAPTRKRKAAGTHGPRSYPAWISRNGEHKEKQPNYKGERGRTQNGQTSQDDCHSLTHNTQPP
jgi:hypothetical protein